MLVFCNFSVFNWPDGVSIAHKQQFIQNDLVSLATKINCTCILPFFPLNLLKPGMHTGNITKDFKAATVLINTGLDNLTIRSVFNKYIQQKRTTKKCKIDWLNCDFLNHKHCVFNGISNIHNVGHLKQFAKSNFIARIIIQVAWNEKRPFSNCNK